MNTQIFAFTTCRDFQSLLEVECREISGIRPVIQTSLDELDSMLGLLQQIDLLILDSPTDLRSIERVRRLLFKYRSKIRSIYIYGEELVTLEKVKLFKRDEISELFDEIKTRLNEEAPKSDGWSSIPLSTLIHFESLPFDLYLKLGESRFVKRIHAFETIDKNLLDSLSDKGVKELSCEKRFIRNFSMMLINNMINKLEKNYPSVNEKLSREEEVFQTTREIIQNLGISGRLVEVCDAAIETMKSGVLKKNDDFSSYLLALQKDRNLSFQFRLINLTNYIGSQLIQDMKLPHLEEQIGKLVFASYFCDMTLKNPGFLYHRSAENCEALSLDEQNEVNFHALKSSELVSQYKDCPKEVALIIKQHHGSFSGIGFPQEKSHQLLPLSKILVVSQDLAYSILSEEETPGLEILRSFIKKNKTQGLTELFNLLESTFSQDAKVLA